MNIPGQESTKMAAESAVSWPQYIWTCGLKEEWKQNEGFGLAWGIPAHEQGRAEYVQGPAGKTSGKYIKYS